VVRATVARKPAGVWGGDRGPGFAGRSESTPPDYALIQPSYNPSYNTKSLSDRGKLTPVDCSQADPRPSAAPRCVHARWWGRTRLPMGAGATVR
jgi:hypothetical protein